MPRTLISQGQELLSADISAISARCEIELYDRIIYELMSRQQNVCFASSFAVSYTNGTTVAVAAGNGTYYDNTQVDPEPMHRLLYLASAGSLTLATPDPTNPRIDLVCIQAARVNASTVSRNVKNVSTSVIAATNVVPETDWGSNIEIVTGTPAGSPSAPSVPTGWLLLAQLTVSASTGLSGPSAVVDRRSLFVPGAASKIGTAITTTYQAVVTDQLITCDMSGSSNASYTVTLPLANLMKYRTVTWLVIAGTGVLTVAANSGDAAGGLITNQNSQTYSTKGTSGSAWSDGTQWWIL